MMRPAIITENIGKQYVIGGLKGRRPAEMAHVGAESEGPAGLRGKLLAPLALFRRKERFWALKDVSFEVKQGEALGIVGRNGSGKSTLLKVLARVTPPTEGQAVTVGRLGSLLEVGAGFHMELTGRENIFLSGSILGMKRREIKARFDEIVDFSGISQFIDTPVKRYSSGMYLRLAFAVAAHLDTEILLVDEVLAVGDSAFQKSCLEKLSSVVKDGRSVLFVSHNLAAISRLCDSGIVLDKGKVAYRGEAVSAVAYYEKMGVEESVSEPAVLSTGLAIRNLKVEGDTRTTRAGESLRFVFDLDLPKEYWTLSIGFGIRTLDGNRLVFDVLDSKDVPSSLGPGRHVIRVELPGLWLRPRTYIAQAKATAYPATGQIEKVLSDTFEFVVWGEKGCGLLDPILQPPVVWRVQRKSDSNPLPGGGVL